MVCGWHRFGMLLALGLVGCSDVRPTEPGGAESAGIVGGANDSTHKGVFGIVIQNRALCSGSLLAPNLVLTAHHCVADLSTGDGDVDCTKSTFGAPFAASGFELTWTQNLNGNVTESSVYGATEVRVPPDDAVCGNDVALIRLDANVPASSAATIEPRVDQAPMTAEPFDAVGYGLNDPGDTAGSSAGIRRYATGSNIACVGALECLGTRARNNEWAAYVPICHGDSGGPALDAQGRVIGVASRADIDCAVGLYSSVSSWKDFLVDGAIDAATAGGYDPPAWTGMPVETDAGAPMMDAGSSAGAPGSGGAGGGAGRSGAAGRASTGAAGRATMPTDAGAPPPDAGTAGTGTAQMGLGPGLGDECTSFCTGDLLCYSPTSKPPGECVEPCASGDTTCPSGYECNQHLGACVPKTPSAEEDVVHSGGCGCRVGAVGSDGPAWQLVGLFAALGGIARRRRRS